jgi:hypothetical protein
LKNFNICILEYVASSYATSIKLIPITFLNKRTPQTKILRQMKTNRDLFEEAIADAKAVKEMAIANAKAALEESFTPHLNKMLSAKLQEMEVEEENVEMYEEEEPTMEAETSQVDEEIDLEELLSNLDEMEVDETDMHEAEVDENVELTEAEEEEAEEAEEEEAEEAVNLEDMSEEDLKDFIEDVIKDMVSAGELEAGHEGMEDEEEVASEDEDEEINIDEVVNDLEEEVNIDEILAELEEGKKEEADKDKEKMKKELEEALDAISTLRSEINEVNLLNAKLLYTNKIFRSKNLTENNKIKVLNSFDKAKTVKETKLVYETILESLKDKKVSNITESLGFASKVTGVPATTKQPIFEADAMISRFQKLAGII